MLGDNIRSIRKSKGFSQEELASKLSVVRQTVSKWEKGLSVPDSEMLVKIGDILEVPVSELLGGERSVEAEEKNAISDQLQRINEQLVIKNRRTKTLIKIVIGFIIAMFLLSGLVRLIFGWAYTVNVEEGEVETYSQAEIIR